MEKILKEKSAKDWHLFMNGMTDKGSHIHMLAPKEWDTNIFSKIQNEIFLG